MAQAPVSLESLLVSREGYRGGRPCLRGTGMTVHQVAVAHQMGMSPDEICEQNPDLDPSLFYAALAYYFANRERIDAEIALDERIGELLAAKFPNGITPETPRERESAARDASVNAKALLTQVSPPDDMRRLFDALAAEKTLADSELEQAQQWALDLFLAELRDAEPNPLGRLADSLLGQIEMLKSCWT